jgi:glycosyltransferase involved in cell wall biosynthesis
MRKVPSVAIVAASLDILGGQGVQARTLVDALRADGCRATLLAINPRFPRGFRWLRRIPYLRTAANQMLYVPGLARLAACDVAHVFSASYASFLLAPVPAMLVARMLNKRVVLHYHSGEAEDHLARWGLLVHPWLGLADEIVVPSAYLARVFARHGYCVRVIPNVVDLTTFVYRERRPLRPRFLSTRNLEAYYGIDVIIKAFARYQQRDPLATLTIAGYGSQEDRLRSLAGLLTRRGIEFVGRVEPGAMPRLYDEADVFLNASVVDNQPVSILEAFAAGLPVISTPAGDIPSMVRHYRTGLIVGPDDPAAMAAAMAAMLGQRERALDMAARAHKELHRFTWPAVRDAWTAVYSRSLVKIAAADPRLPASESLIPAPDIHG